VNWKILEDKVRSLASSKWGRPATAAMINNVHFDCVVEISENHRIVIEVSKSSTIEKLRTDLAKFSSIDNYLWSKRIFCEFYFVADKALSDEFRGTAKGNNVTAYSLEEFETFIFDYKSYAYQRLKHGFGSAVDPHTGEPDQKDYIKVRYHNSRTNHEITLEDIEGMLAQGRSIILTGDYGTGKSRLVKELFSTSSKSLPRELKYPIAVDLRGCWGVKRGPELVRRHFDDLGLTKMADDIIKMMPDGKVTWLFDGFDELGLQAWASDPRKMQELRKEALLPIKELLKNKKNSFLITGRSYYFNSDNEMLECLGVRREDVTIVQCKEEFSAEEFNQYFSNQSIEFPHWLPKRPLVAYMLGRVEPASLRQYTREDDDSEYKFWDLFFKTLGQRESGINNILDGAVILSVLKTLSRICRSKNMPNGPITTDDISESFKNVTDMTPDVSSLQMLQRLPCLGRFETDSEDRVFVDAYVLDGIRGEDLTEIVTTNNIQLDDRGWKHPTGAFGIGVAAYNINKIQSNNLILQHLRTRSKIISSGILNGDLLAILLSTDHSGPINCDINNTHIIELNLSEKTIKGLNISQSLIDKIFAGGEELTEVTISDSHVSNIVGVGSRIQVERWLHESTSVDHFDEISNSSSILHSNLTNAQKILLILIQRLFFQPGAGRKERALFRGLGEVKDSKISKDIIRLMKSEGLISEHQGNEGIVYLPNRKDMGRMRRIKDSQMSSDDVLWKLSCSLS